jgi:CheY-like chemotaxis protein
MMMDNILIIDDNIPLLETLAMVMGTQLKSCSILTASNGREGIAMINSMPIALILTDLEMPVVDGYGVIDYRNKNCPQVPLFVMSGSLSPEVRGMLGRLSVSACIEKPFYFEQVKEIMELALNLEPINDAKNTCRPLQPASVT